MPKIGDFSLVNLGCGHRYHPGWINFDLVASGGNVRTCDLGKGIPLSNASQDVVYSAAFLEHLEPAEASNLLREAWRVLRPGGICRIGVPDTEQICRLYLEALEKTRRGHPNGPLERDWFLLELADQGFRNWSGGHMKPLTRQATEQMKKLIQKRIGSEMFETGGHQGRLTFGGLQRRWQLLLARIFLGRRAARALGIGLFRMSGETHRWLPDETSLGEMMQVAGFRDLQRHSAYTSSVLSWDSYGLDVSPEGLAYKPDLFFLEGRRPA